MRKVIRPHAILVYNALVKKLHRESSEHEDSDVAAIRARASNGTDISSHLERLFVEGVRASPKLIVELGVRGGESTFVLEKVARRCAADLVSVDVADCSLACEYKRWHFVQADDVAFGRRFRAWARERGLATEVDLLFIDTSHSYEHTLAEIQVWFPCLSKRSVVIFHDTNLRALYRRHDWTLGSAWDNARGVIRALELVLQVKFDECHAFERQVGDWHVVHDPVCNGLTVLRKG